MYCCCCNSASAQVHRQQGWQAGRQACLCVCFVVALAAAAHWHELKSSANVNYIYVCYKCALEVYVLHILQQRRRNAICEHVALANV